MIYDQVSVNSMESVIYRHIILTVPAAYSTDVCHPIHGKVVQGRFW